MTTKSDQPIIRLNYRKDKLDKMLENLHSSDDTALCTDIIVGIRAVNTALNSAAMLEDMNDKRVSHERLRRIAIAEKINPRSPQVFHIGPSDQFSSSGWLMYDQSAAKRDQQLERRLSAEYRQQRLASRSEWVESIDEIVAFHERMISIIDSEAARIRDTAFHDFDEARAAYAKAADAYDSR